MADKVSHHLVKEKDWLTYEIRNLRLDSNQSRRHGKPKVINTRARLHTKKSNISELWTSVPSVVDTKRLKYRSLCARLCVYYCTQQHYWDADDVWRRAGDMTIIVISGARRMHTREVMTLPGRGPGSYTRVDTWTFRHRVEPTHTFSLQRQ